jgi:hypothetical protein
VLRGKPFYTAFHIQHTDGTPAVQSLFFQYPQDIRTYDIQFQFLFSPSTLVTYYGLYGLAKPGYARFEGTPLWGTIINLGRAQ